MAKTETGKATAAFKNFSEKARGTDDWGKEVSVEYDFEYKVLGTLDEVRSEFTDAQLITLANQRLKGNANSAARAKAESDYKLDPNSPEAKRQAFIKSIMALGKTEAEAEEFAKLAMA
jgi:hypothetical protein